MIAVTVHYRPTPSFFRTQMLLLSCEIRGFGQRQGICSTDVEIISMSGRIYLGELEELILLMVAIIGARAYGVSVTEELEAQTGRVITISAAHAVLHRLEEKGFVKSKMGGASMDRGGRRKRLFQITAYGRQTLQEVRDVRNMVWAQLPNI